MSPPRPSLQQLATRLLEEEAGGSAITVRVTEVVFARLRARLVELVGVRGFEALLRRALQLARADTPALEGVQTTPGGGLSGLPVESAESAEPSTAPMWLLAHFLELLATFIGADLAARLARGPQRDGGLPERGPEDS